MQLLVLSVLLSSFKAIFVRSLLRVFWPLLFAVDTDGGALIFFISFFNAIAFQLYMVGSYICMCYSLCGSHRYFLYFGDDTTVLLRVLLTLIPVYEVSTNFFRFIMGLRFHFRYDTSRSIVISLIVKMKYHF